MQIKPRKYPKRSPYYYARFSIAGVRIFESTQTTDYQEALRYCEKRRREVYAQVKLGVQPPCTFAEALEVYINSGGEKRFTVKLLDHFRERPLREIGQAEIDEAARIICPQGKASTINRQITSKVIAIGRAAIHAELPGAALRPIKRRREIKPIITPADDRHIAALLPYCSEGLRALILLMTYTGLRTGEALRVRKEDCKDGYIRVGHTKNGEPRNAPCPHGWSFPQSGFGFKTTQGVGRALRKASERAGIAYRDGHEIGRHAFAARFLGGGYSIKALKEAGGWKKLSVVDSHYGHMEQSEVHATIRKLSAEGKLT
jgi:integrase